MRPNRQVLGDRDLLAAITLGLIGILLWQNSSLRIALILVIAGTTVAILSPTGAFWATCAAVPFWQHPVAIGAYDFSLLEIGIVISAAGALGSQFLSVALRSRSLRIPFVPAPILLLAVGLVLAGLLSLWFMPDHSHQAEALRMVRWTILEPVAALVLTLLAIQDRGIRPLVVSLVLPAVLVTASALGELMSGANAFRADNVIRATGPYLHPNNLALFLERMTLLAAAPAIFPRVARQNAWRSMSALLFVGVLLTFSRGALLALATGWLVLAIVHRSKWMFWSGLAAGLATLAGLLVFASDRLTGAASSGIGTTRMSLWRSSIRMIRDFPVSGIGLDQFLYWYPVRYIQPANWSERYLSHPHNLIVDSWLSLGLAGLTVFLFGVVLLTYMFFRISQARAAIDPFVAGALAALCGGLAHGLVDNGYFLPDLSFLTWVLVGIIIFNLSTRHSLDIGWEKPILPMKRTGAF